MRPLAVLLNLLLIVLVLVAPTAAQEADTVSCPLCGEPNLEKNNYCTSCGARLTARKPEVRQTAPTSYLQPARLFSLPMASALPESYLGFTFGNNFGIQVGESILGTASLGVGGIGEIELSTTGLITSVVNHRAAFRTAGMKIWLYADKGGVPAVGVSLRSSNDWERESRDERMIAFTDPSAHTFGLRSFNLESRITTLSLLISKQMREQTTVHAGIGFSDIRYRNVYSGFISRFVYDPSERRTNQWQVFGGASIMLNSRTTVLAEVQTLPLFKYDVKRDVVRLTRIYVGAAGIRFSLTPSWSLDGGIRYQDNFVGLADVQFRISVSVLVLVG